MFLKIILERFLECPQCLAAVRNLRLFFCRKLCKGLSLVRHEEHGIVAEAVSPIGANAIVPSTSPSSCKTSPFGNAQVIVVWKWARRSA